jgi:hypothetical protein
MMVDEQILGYAGSLFALSMSVPPDRLYLHAITASLSILGKEEGFPGVESPMKPQVFQFAIIKGHG